MTDDQLLQRLAAIENNTNANTSQLLAIQAILAAMPETTNIDTVKIQHLLAGLTTPRPLANLLPAATACAEQILINAHEAARH
jgi:hypothetical protein